MSISPPFVVTQELQRSPPVNATAPGVDAGVLGLEARHTWWGEFGPVMLNHLWDDAGNRVIPAKPGAILRPGRAAVGAIYSLTKISGLHSRADADDNRANFNGHYGEEVYPSLQRGKTVTYEGTIIGATLADLRRAETQLRRAVSGTYETFMLIEPHPNYGSVPWAYFGRAMQLDLADEQTNSPSDAKGPYQRPFIFAVRQNDPRYYVWQQRAAGGLPPNTGSAVVNNGSAPSDPLITIRAVAGQYIQATVQVFNDTLGRRLALGGVPSSPGIDWTILTANASNGWIEFNFRDRTIRNESGINLLAGIDIYNSGWWDNSMPGLVPGSNILRVQGTNIASFDVQWLDASW